MKKKEDILDKIGGKTGYKVPDGYFEQLTTRITEQLPERELPQPEVITPWQKFSPYIYMAAMFAGIWLMIQAFVTPTIEADRLRTAEAEQEAQSEAELEEYMLYSLDEYTIFESFYADND
jgi:hypothetical protein